MQIDPHALTPSQDGSVHSKGGTAGVRPATTPCSFCRGSCGPTGAQGSWCPLCVVSAVVSMSPCVHCGDEAWQTLWMTWWQVIGAALQTCRPTHRAPTMQAGLWDSGWSHGMGWGREGVLGLILFHAMGH